MQHTSSSQGEEGERFCFGLRSPFLNQMIPFHGRFADLGFKVFVSGFHVQFSIQIQSRELTSVILREMMVFLATAVDQQQPFDFRLFVFSAGGCFLLLLLATANSWLSSYGCRVASDEGGNRFCWLF